MPDLCCLNTIPSQFLFSFSKEPMIIVLVYGRTLT
jgi:hypothetical protein